MEFELKFGGQRLGVIRFEVDPSVFMPLLQKLAMFGLGFQEVKPEEPGRGKR